MSRAGDRAAAAKRRRLEAHAALLTAIAQKHLALDTLEVRNSDQLDFHERHVGQIRAALEAAYAAGRASR